MSRFRRRVTLPFRAWWWLRPSRLPRPFARRLVRPWMRLHRPLPLVAHANPNLVQTAFRFRNDDGSETTATWRQIESVTDITPVDTTFRVRIQVEENATGSGSCGGQLQVALGAAGSFQNVTTSSTIAKAVSSANVSDGTATTNQLTNVYAAGQAGGTISTDGLATAVTLSATAAEFEFVVQIVGADVNDGDLLTFRIAGLNSIETAAALTVSKPGGGGATGIPDVVMAPLTH